MSHSEINKALYPKRRGKYNAVRTEVDGRWFASKREAEAFVYLRALERAGTLRGLECQVPFPLNGVSVKTGKPEKVCIYIADFVAQTLDGQTVVYDAKGMRTAVYRMKAKWFEMQYGFRITEL